MLRMSHLKRPWDNVGTVPNPCGVAYVKRRAVSHLSIPSNPNDASNDDSSSDQDMASFTVDSTSTALSEVHSSLSVSLFPGKSTSPTFAQSGSESGNIKEQLSSKRGICFGMVRYNWHFSSIMGLTGKPSSSTAG